MAKFDDLNIQPGTGDLYEYDKQGGTSSPTQVTKRRVGSGDESTHVPSTESTSNDGQALLDLIGMINSGDGIGVYGSRSYNTFSFKSLLAGENIDITSDPETITISATGTATLPPLQEYFYTDADFPVGDRDKIIKVSADGQRLEYIDAGLVGASIQLKGAAATVGELPTTGNEEGDAWIVNGELFVWTNDEFVSAGNIRGEQGVPGEQGEPGEPGTNGTNGLNGIGVPVGGTAGQVLSKVDGQNYNTEWVTPESGGGISTVATSDSNSVDFSGNGSIASPLSAEVKVSADSNNALELRSGGLFAPTGSVGPAGNPGKSAYTIAVENGFSGTETEWLASLKGTPGTGVPVGGATGQVLTKVNGADYNVQWSSPVGGSTYIEATESVNFTGLGTSGSPYKLNSVISTDNGNALESRATGLYAPGIPNGGSTGQVLTKNSGINGDYSWLTPAGGGGSGVEVVKGRFVYSTSGDGSVASIDLPTGWTLIGSNGFLIRVDTGRTDLPINVYFVGADTGITPTQFTYKTLGGGMNIYVPNGDGSVLHIDSPVGAWTGAGLSDYADFFFVYPSAN